LRGIIESIVEILFPLPKERLDEKACSHEKENLILNRPQIIKKIYILK
jgi:hypothetical protein